jgi:hypothetical protein
MDRDFEIKIGDKGLPQQFYRGKSFTLSSGERYFNNGKNKMHWWVWEHEHGRKRPKGYHIHHIDGNTWNNRIENLELIESKKHLSSHIKKRVEENKEWFIEFHKKGIAKAPEWHKSPEGIKWHKEHAKNHNFGKQDYGMAKCLLCEKEYLKKTAFAKYCHPNCKAKALRIRRKLEGKSL